MQYAGVSALAIGACFAMAILPSVIGVPAMLAMTAAALMLLGD